MKKLLIALLVIFPVGVGVSLSFIDKVPFYCPLSCVHSVSVRVDTRGNGFFASPRNGSRQHRGVDLAAPIGTPVYAARSGVVTVARNEEKGMGNYVVISHLGQMTTLYGHLSRITVRAGQYVRQGDRIGLVGKTGNANSPAMTPHLHFEVKQNGVPQDPLSYLQ